jgi:hypothetical protein
MSDLQGTIIPTLKVFGWLPDGRYAMGISYCGDYPEWTEKEKRNALDVVRKFHRVGYLHRDMKADQFVVCGDGEMFLIDLGRVTRMKGNSRSAETEYKELERWLYWKPPQS